LATGAHPRVQEIPGLEKRRALTAWEVLAGEKDITGPCLVLGAGLVGCETADYLSQRGMEVILVEVLPEISRGADGDTKAYFAMRFQKNHVKVYTGTELRRMEGKSAILKRGDEDIRVHAETVIFGVGAEPEDGLFDRLKALGLSVVKVGDCMKPRSILEAVKEGYQVGMNV